MGGEPIPLEVEEIKDLRIGLGGAGNQKMLVARATRVTVMPQRLRRQANHASGSRRSGPMYQLSGLAWRSKAQSPNSARSCGMSTGVSWMRLLAFRSGRSALR
jgi:hypothetical protein